MVYYKFRSVLLPSLTGNLSYKKLYGGIPAITGTQINMTTCNVDMANICPNFDVINDDEE